MIKSMTGFAALTREDERATLAVTIRAVNHRYLDVQLRLAAPLAALEPRLRNLLQRRVARGRIELSVGLQMRDAPSLDVEFNERLADALLSAVERARQRGLVSGPLTPGDLLRVPQALVVRERAADGTVDAALSDSVDDVVGTALDELDAMRVREGTHLRKDLEQRRAAVVELVDEVEKAAREGRADLQSRLEARVRELTTGLEPDAAAVAQEIVRVAARSDISEELARFRAHVAHWEVMLGAPESCGRKLDFLLQEMNREVNTIGAKADGLRVSELIVEMKAELEKLREQVQNVE